MTAEPRRIREPGGGTYDLWDLPTDEATLYDLLGRHIVDDDQNILPEPDWDRLAAWDDLRHRYLALEPDPVDRSGRGFRHQ